MTTQLAVGSGEVCRLTVYSPASRVELAVPVHVPVADLLPTILGHLGPELATTGMEHGGWVLQRLGEPPLQEDLGAAALGLYDGDILYVRPHDEQLPPVDFDDIVDGVATGIAERKDAWRPALTRRFALGLAGLALAMGALLIPALGSGGSRVVVAGAIAALLVVAAAAAARAYGDPGAGATLAVAAVGYAVLTGLLLPVFAGPVDPLRLLTAPGLLAAGTFGTAAAVSAQVGIGALRAALSGTAAAAILTAVAGLLGSTTRSNSAHVAAIVLPVVLLLAYLVPSIGAKLAGIRILPLPVNPDEFQQDVEPEPSQRLLDRTAQANTYITALYAGLAVVCGGCLVVLARAPGRSAPVLALVAALMVLLHSRELVGVWQRLVTAASGVLGLLALVADQCAGRSAGFRLLVVLLLVLVALLACVAARVLPGRRLLPHWGYAGDIAHWLAAAAVIPLALSVAGVYGRVRGVWS
jgi:type VII secretion integral membrane protein EccD